MTAVIVGGGIAGLTAAYELVKAGERPYIIEPGPIGGMVRTFLQNGFTLECGPNVLVEREDLRLLLAELKLSASVHYPAVARYGQYVWHDGAPRKVPAGLFEFLASPLFGLATKAQLPVKFFVPGILPSKLEDCSVLDFFSPLLGAQTVKTLLDPVLKGIYGGDVAELSARTLFSNLWRAAREGRSVFGYMRMRSSAGKPPILVIGGGMQALADALWKAIETHVSLVPHRVTGISALQGQRYQVLLENGQSIEADGCLLTTAGKKTASIIGRLSEDLADTLSGVRSAGLVVVHLKVPRSALLIPDAFGVLFPAGMPEDMLGIMFNSIIFPHVAPPDCHLLTVVLGGTQADGRVFQEEELRERLPPLLSKLLGIRDAQWLSITQWHEAIPQLVVGHHQIVEQLDLCEKVFPGIVFAGVDRGGVGVSDRIKISREAVRRFRATRVETVV